MTHVHEPSHEENTALVAEANAAGMLVSWSRLPHADCPHCHQHGVVDIRQVYEAAPIGTFSLAGAQVKVPVRIAWEYKCSACEVTGKFRPEK